MLKKMDLHIHSLYSDGNASIEQILQIADDNKMDIIAITDHYDRNDPLAISRGPEKNEFMRNVSKIREISNNFKTEVLIGVETCISPDGTVPVEDELMRKLDLVITSCHYIKETEYMYRKGNLFDENYWSVYKRKILEVSNNRQTNVIGHIFGYLPIRNLLDFHTTYDQRLDICREIVEKYFDTEWQDRLIDNMKRNNIAVEIHVPSKTPGENFLRKSLEAGLKFSIGSDAHNVEDICRIEEAYTILESIGAKQTDMIF